ncbi:ShlB/FhaC/HecB family hemolysin secretion/activation protein [Croceivirga sp. JEA036]|uniref:ShlB/FhaC/HecB family hemolysin secretion/activation protein n=1 Tax=Croceivirga sp. JEA036 TaxID=2721162 RepID=UPI00143960A2|nr:hypothetical protein [Croceivirga sp. JEA036]NJB37711.1 hypothetical protein [Croceivirga sp. JEA036]
MLTSQIKIIKHKYLFVLSAMLTLGCATHKPQEIKLANAENLKKDTPVYTFYLAGNYGNAAQQPNKTTLNALRNTLKDAPENSMMIFTGDNITNLEDNWDKDKKVLKEQLALVEGYRGKTLFIPGNNAWKQHDTNTVEDVENYIKDQELENIEYYPKNACPLEYKVINDQLDLIVVDSKWFISNWSREKDINKKCHIIDTRRRFMEELEGYLNDAQGKNIVIAMHHPIFSNGEYAGHASLKDHLTPFPIYGSLKEAMLDLGAFDPDHLNSRRYNYLRILVAALSQTAERVTIVSGHEESLQYLTGGNIHQVISGALADVQGTNRGKDRITAIGGTLEFEGQYTHGTNGFAKLEYFKDGSSKVTFITPEENQKEKTLAVLGALPTYDSSKTYAKTNKSIAVASVLTDPKAYKKLGLYKFLWGDRYRNYFGEQVKAPVAYLDTLYGGLSVVKEGGGHQSFSLRLEDKDGKQYNMRSLKKSAMKYLRFQLPGVSFNEEDYLDTFPEEVVTDFFTSAHPYMQLAINPLARKVGINHSDTKLYYIPKQEILEEHNETFGDELYFIERRPSDEQLHYKGYRRTITEAGRIKDFESTTDMLELIASDEDYTIDQRNYIRARLFDMLIGDWDRHQDQWRWVEYEKEDGTVELMPVPRDRDNAFPKFDGFALKLIKLFAPNSRRFQSYDANFQSVKWLNVGGNKLDRALLNEYDVAIWKEEAQYIIDNLSDATIDKAFTNLPIEVQDNTVERIKTQLKLRRGQLQKAAEDYAKYLNKVVAVTGTEKDDKFQIERLVDGKTRVTVERIFSDKQNEVMYDRTFTKDVTKEIWIYGLGDDDVFEIKGDGDHKIKLRIVGGYGEDAYDFENTNRVKLYEWDHEKSEFKDKVPAKQMSDIYTTNNYHWRYFKPNMNIVAPKIGFRTDDGLFVGLGDTYIKQGLNADDFKQKHSFLANYYFGFKAVELQYTGVFANIFPKWNFEVEGYYTSDKYTKNFFGIGNETINNEDALDRDYYRARIRQIKARAGIAYYDLRFNALFESFEVSENENRLFNPSNLNPALFDAQNYAGAEVSAQYDRDNADDFPTKAILFALRAGYKMNLDNSDNKFGYASFKTAFAHKLLNSGNLVLASEAEVSTNIGANPYYFYHAQSLGGNNGLRGFRDERFAGHSYFYQSTDLKLRLGHTVTPVTPVTFGLYGGFDYGRVWEREQVSNEWHTSQGGGLWISTLKAFNFNIGYFNSKENNLIQVGFGYDF